MTFKNKYIYYAIMLYLAVPIMIFMITWLTADIGFIAAGAILISMIIFLRNNSLIDKDVADIRIDVQTIIVAIILFIFLLSTGHGGFIGTIGHDIPWRDAIYQDLIHNEWPLIYDTSDTMFCYYMTFWLIPAGISSLLELSIFSSNIVLFIWTYIGLCFIVFLICKHLKVKAGYIIVVAIIFLFFSGMNTLGMMFRSIFAKTPLMIDINDYPGLHSWMFAGGMIGDYPVVYYIRTTYDSLANVYNQYIHTCIITMLFLLNKNNIKCSIFITMLLLPYSPIGFLGLVIVVFFYYLSVYFSSGNKMLMIRQVLSIENIFSMISIMPIFYLYFTANNMAGNVTDSGILYVPLNQYGGMRILLLCMFYVLYFIFYMMLLDKKYRNNVLFWISGILLMVLPIFRIGVGGDLLWNGSVPAYFIIMLMIIDQILVAMKKHIFWGKDLVLVITLTIAFITPMLQITSSFRGAYMQHSISYYNDPSNINKTFADKNPDELRNFLVKDYKNTSFYKYLVDK